MADRIERQPKVTDHMRVLLILAGEIVRCSEHVGGVGSA
jgi:hypothetical protein